MTRLLLILCLATPFATPIASQGRPMTVHDMMAFRQIQGAAIDPLGKWVAYEARPDRGDGSGWVVSTDGETRREVERGRKPVFSEDGKWVAFTIAPPFEEAEKATKDKKPKPGAALMLLENGRVERYERVAKFAFSKTGNALVVEHHPADDDAKKKAGDNAPPTPHSVRIVPLPLGPCEVQRSATAWALDPKGRWVVIAVNGDEHGMLFGRYLTPDAWGPEVSTFAQRRLLMTLPRGRIASPTFSKDGSRLAWLAAPIIDGKPGAATVWTWDGTSEPVAAKGVDATIPIDAPLEWSRDGSRLFFGTRTRAEKPEPATDDAVAKLLDKRTLDVWHADDPFISPHQKKRWKTEKKRTFLAVLHVDDGTVVPLADDAAPDVTVPKNGRVALATSDVPYRKARTWDLPRRDVYTVDLRSGEKTRVATGVQSGARLSPGGAFVVWYDDGHWHLWDVAKKQARSLTTDLDVSFANETHDYPYPAPGYGIAGFEADDRAVWIYDRFDVWRVPTGGGPPKRLTDGRPTRTETRLVTVDRDGDTIDERTARLATFYSDAAKTRAIGRIGEAPAFDGPHRYSIVAKAKAADAILYTRESYTEFPDLWVTRLNGKPPVELTDLGRQTDGIAWGTAELVRWKSTTGEPLDGVVIKPDGFDPSKRYPVVVYFYRKFSQRLHEFNEVVVNHRPCFPYYASDGYVVFLPDVNFEIGAPGPSATRCLVPGIERLVELGIADPERIGLHGHSWSGYQTAFVITETNAFRTAVAGAPVSNMTSAYGGIRWQTGLSRQFQYERTQSRIGGSLWETRDRYIANSPVFLADKIETPLLIQFGDEDGAVPWYQGIEFYMAMRRLGKPCVFLQYRGEGHHLKRYPNKLDYTLKMKAWFDHYLKDAPAPTWIRAGEPYRGK